MLEDGTVYQQYLESIRYEQLWQAVSKNLRFSRFLSEETHWKFVLNERVIKKYFYHAKKVRECHRIVEKTPKHLLRSQRIFRTFPQSKMLITIRHPVEVFSSYIKRKQVETESKWLDVTVQEFVDRYSNMVKHVETLGIKKEVLCLKYEDFISDPENKFREICYHLNEPFESEPIKEAEPQLSYLKSDPYLSKPITQNTKKWSDYITSEQVEFIEDHLKNEMASFGYASKLTQG